MRSDHLAKHVKTHNGNSTPGSAGKKGSSESCSDSEEPNTSDLHQSSPSNNNNNSTTHNNNSLTTSAHGGMDVSGLHVQHHHQHNNNTMILSPHQLNAPLLYHHQHHHHTPSPGLEHVNQLDIKPGIV